MVNRRSPPSSTSDLFFPLRSVLIRFFLLIVVSSISSLFRHHHHPCRHHHDHDDHDVVSSVVVEAYHRKPCTRSIRKQFQFPDCYLPDMVHPQEGSDDYDDDDLLLSEAGFLMSHDAATGYLPTTSLLTSSYPVTAVLSNSYAKNQIGTVYQQLNDGARALDVRPKILFNGTVVCHHGAVVIPVTLERLVQDAIRWCQDNPDELVLILHNDLAYPTTSSSSRQQQSQQQEQLDDDYDNDTNENYNDNNNGVSTASITPSADVAVSVLSQIYDKLGVTYVPCTQLYGLTVRQTMELAALPNDGGGYLLAIDQHDAYASSCAKQNYVQDLMVTCYSNGTTGTGSSTSGDTSTATTAAPCTNQMSTQRLQALKEYVMASANNEPTDDNQRLGPPASTYLYPFNEIQALWQVDAVSATLGVAHISTLIDDNTKSQINAHVVDWIYEEGSFDGISILAVDHVQLNGNAILSVLRNQCGQSELSSAYLNDDSDMDGQQSKTGDDGTLPCGRILPKPKMQSKPMSTLSFLVTLLVFVAFGVWLAILWEHYRRYYRGNQQQLQALDREILQVAQQHFGCNVGNEGRQQREFDDDTNNRFVLMR